MSGDAFSPPPVASLDVGAVAEAIETLLDEAGEDALPVERAQPVAGLRSTALLVDAGLLDPDGRPRFRVNELGGRLFVTDVPEATRAGGVFPYPDEAERLLAWLRRDGAAASEVVEVGSGCGHVLLSVAAERRAGVDVAERAGALLRLNAELNAVAADWRLGDAARGLAALGLNGASGGSVHVVGNLPHAPSPGEGRLAGFANGGPTGAEVIAATLRGLAAERGHWSRITLLAYSLAGPEGREPHVASLARALFPPGAVSWHPLEGEPMWRIDGEMAERSPMPVEALARKADCRHYTDPSRRDEVRRAYEALAARLRADGWDRLEYGVLDVAG